MKILLVEDDQPTSELLSAKLSAHCYAVDAIADGSAGLDLATQWDYDLILLDVLLPTLSGVEVCRRLRVQDRQTPILMLTTKDSNEDVIAGLDAGADDYVAKSCDFSQLLARVRALLRRGGSDSLSPILTWGSLCFDPALARVTYNQQAIAFRLKEYSLLELFLRHPQRIFSRSAIIDHLWSMDDTPVEGSVTNLIKDLRHRLKSAGMDADLIETVYGLGYRLKAAPTDEVAADFPERRSTERSRRSPPNGRREDGEDGGNTPVSALMEGWMSNAWDDREQRGRAAVHQVTDRFRGSLEQRIAALEAVERSLQAGNFIWQQQQDAQTEAHKLAGGLGTFGYIKASAIAQTIEHLLENDLSQETRLANQFAQLLEELKQAIAQPSTNAAIV